VDERATPILFGSVSECGVTHVHLGHDDPRSCVARLTVIELPPFNTLGSWSAHQDTADHGYNATIACPAERYLFLAERLGSAWVDTVLSSGSRITATTSTSHGGRITGYERSAIQLCHFNPLSMLRCFKLGTCLLRRMPLYRIPTSLNTNLTIPPRPTEPSSHHPQVALMTNLDVCTGDGPARRAEQSRLRN